MERGSISKPRRGASGETKPAYTLTLNLHPRQPWGINFCVSHPFCGILSRQPMQMNAVSRLKQDAWFLEPRGEAFSTQFFRNFSEGPRASLGSNIRELPGKKLRREERLPPALLLRVSFSVTLIFWRWKATEVTCYVVTGEFEQSQFVQD